MTKSEYEGYQKTVSEFLEDFDSEPSGGCWRIEGQSDEDHEKRSEDLEPFFSCLRCPCCKSTLGGDRHQHIGWYKGARDNSYSDEYKWEGYLCSDCLYYICYGALDDQTMIEIQNS